MTAAVTRQRIAILGNSNSVMRSSFARLLANNPALDVHNFSLGAAPNVYLMFALATVDLERFDYIIFETAVTDAEWCRLGLYDKEHVLRNLEWAVDILHAKSLAQILFIILPTINELEDDTYSTESLYTEFCTRNDIPYFNFYALYRDFKSSVTRQFFFEDWLHLSPAMHRILARMVGRYIGATERLTLSKNLEVASQTQVYTANPLDIQRYERILRRTSLQSSEMVILKEEEWVEYKFDRSVMLSSFAVNRQETSCVVEINCDDQIFYRDLRLTHDNRNLRFLHENPEFVLHLVPLQAHIYGRQFRFRVLPPQDIQPNMQIERGSHPSPHINLAKMELSTAVFVGAESYEIPDRPRRPKDETIVYVPFDLDISHILPTPSERGDLLKFGYDFSVMAMNGSRGAVEAQAHWMRPLVNDLPEHKRGALLHAIAKALFLAGELNASSDYVAAAVSLEPGNSVYATLQAKLEAARNLHAAAMEAAAGDQLTWE